MTRTNERAINAMSDVWASKGSTLSRGLTIILGTKAQYVKMAPVIRRLEDRGIPFRLVDTGQHATFARQIRDELDLPEPDVCLREGSDIASIRAAVVWLLRLTLIGLSRRRARAIVCGAATPTVCVIHGDTPSTLLGALLAKRAGGTVVHVEAGLRSWRLTQPFPEELIRVIVMRFADVLIAPSMEATRNLIAMRLTGQIYTTNGNTGLDAISCSERPDERYDIIVSVHRVENLRSSSRMRFLESLLRDLADRFSILFVMHPPTVGVLSRTGIRESLESAGITFVPLMRHGKFVAHLASASFVISDGGSVQEECAHLGVPLLVFRDATEREDGLGATAVLSRFSETVTQSFLDGVARSRRQRQSIASSPSGEVVDILSRLVS